MKNSRYTAEQVAFAMRQVESGTSHSSLGYRPPAPEAIMSVTLT